MKRSAVVLASLSLLALTCKKEPPPAVQVPALELVAEDASCTEAWLRIRSLQVPATVQLVRDGQAVSVISLRVSDSLVIDEGLLPRRTYTYKAQLLEPQTPNLIASTPDVHVTTMDTTSHNFTWQIDTLGDGGGSVLYDVAIINDTLAYAVGEIYKRDSTGNWDPTPYGLAIWNGRMWTLRKLFAQYPGVGSPSLVRPHGIFVFSEANIWFADADVFWWDGRSQLLRVHQVVNTVLSAGQYVDKIWASSPSNIYAVGANGAIAHYDGVRWRRIESGTTLPIVDILGVRDANGVYEILAVADGYDRPEGSYVLSIKNNAVQPVWHDPRPYGLDEVWFIPARQYVVVGSGVWKSYSSGPAAAWSPIGNLPPIHSTSIDGQALNDFVIGGAFWNLMHFNGRTWAVYFPLASGSFTGIAIKENLLVAVGGIGRAIAVRGRR